VEVIKSILADALALISLNPIIYGFHLTITYKVVFFSSVNNPI
jgi:hypothetical protein